MIPAGINHESLRSIMQEAGRILLSYFDKKLTFTLKDQAGFVTQADLASEQYLIKSLGNLLPQAAFFAEESGKSGSGDYCWVIDPLDGTTNFAHRLPYFCISVALTYQDKPIVGAIYQPLLEDFFYAQRGGGATLNGVQVRVREQHDLSRTVMAVGFPYAKNKQFMELVEGVQRILPETHALRYFGAVALDLAYVAAGSLDGAFFEGLGWWDVAAGIVLIEEAGGIVTDFTGRQVGPDYVSFVAANEPMHEKLTHLLTVRPASSPR
jgi:myo-inositol-1(or 4)-monophosphatase